MLLSELNSKRHRARLSHLCVLASLVFLAACGTSVPERSSEEFKTATRAFYVGVAALDVGDDRRARAELERVTELVRSEAAAWNNLGVLHLRHKELDRANGALDKAREISGDRPAILQNLAVVARQRGQSDESVDLLNRTLEVSPGDPLVLGALANEFERRTEEEKALEKYAEISTALPKNAAAALEVARLHAKFGRQAEAVAALQTLRQRVDSLSDEAKEQLAKLERAGNPSEMALEIAYLRNILLREPWFRAELAAFRPSETNVGELIRTPLVLPAAEAKIAEHDASLNFVAEELRPESAEFAVPVFTGGGEMPAVMAAGAESIRIGETTIAGKPSRSTQVAVFDFDYDFRNDLAVADGSGFRLFRASETGEFLDITAGTKLPREILNQSYEGVWTIDVEHDGDLDLLISPTNSAPKGLQNNSDGTFTVSNNFSGVEGVKDLVYADLDEDGDADAFFLTGSGELRYFTNERGGAFRADARTLTTEALAIELGDVSGDATLDLLVLKAEQIDVLILGGDDTLAFSRPIPVRDIDCGSGCRLLTADLDNNAGLDIVVASDASSVMLLQTNEGAFEQLPATITGKINGHADLNNDGRLDLLGTGVDGRVTRFINQGSKNYHWQIVRPRAAKTEGDQRVNSFGIGSEIEVRTGVTAQKRSVDAPFVHFGLGENEQVDVMRVVWGNGYVQAEFDLASDQAIAAEQRLKGSCPHLFAWNGEEFGFVKDAPPWSPALGLKINAQDTYGILQTEEWFKIPGEMLKPRDGEYELRITAEYWETFYLDRYRLIAVDHPAGTEIFTDERFSIPLPPLEIIATNERREFAKALGTRSQDVRDTVRAVDEVYLGDFKKSKFQGVAEEHFVELYLPNNAPGNGLVLVADGWVYPTDASINVQLGQSSFDPPKSIELQVLDHQGNWVAKASNLGFPAGKFKTVVFDLPAGHRAFRLRTNMEIYWDRLAWAERADVGFEAHDLELASSTLNYRGFSEMDKPSETAPERPKYERISTTGQKWRDLEGFYTRFGDVTELLTSGDNRFVLSNAGDELSLKFPALPDPKPGMVRDFVLVGNGWIKDGDLNSVFSRTVLPLPSLESNDYTRKPTTLEDDPVYLKHRRDWITYHTRYVAPERFRGRVRETH